MADQLMSLEELQKLENYARMDGILLVDNVLRICKTARAAHELQKENEKLREQFRTARRDERERCAATCEKIYDIFYQSNFHKWPEMQTNAETGIDNCIAAIRALGDAG